MARKSKTELTTIVLQDSYIVKLSSKHSNTHRLVLCPGFIMEASQAGLTAEACDLLTCQE